MTGKPSDFWSRRRAAVAEQETKETEAREAEARAAEDAQLEERPDEEILAELDLPAPEKMDDVEQVQALLRAAVPQRLRTRALRRLWRLNPVFANVDGLVEYGEDYTDAATVVENIQTLFKVGKGMFDKEAEVQATAERAAERTKAQEAAEEQHEQPDESVQEDDAPTAEAEDASPAAKPEPETDTTDPAPVTARRMRFSFDADT